MIGQPGKLPRDLRPPSAGGPVGRGRGQVMPAWMTTEKAAGTTAVATPPAATLEAVAADASKSAGGVVGTDSTDAEADAVEKAAKVAAFMEERKKAKAAAAAAAAAEADSAAGAAATEPELPQEPEAAAEPEPPPALQVGDRADFLAVGAPAKVRACPVQLLDR